MPRLATHCIHSETKLESEHEPKKSFRQSDFAEDLTLSRCPLLSRHGPKPLQHGGPTLPH